MPLGLGRVQQVVHGIVIDLIVVLPEHLERAGLALEVGLGDRLQRQVAAHVFLDPVWSWIVRRVRAWEADFQKQWSVGLWFGTQPPSGCVANKVVRLHVSRKLPFERAEAFAIVGSLSIEFPLLLNQSPRLQGLVPFVEVVAFFEVAVLVLNDVAFVKAQRRVVRVGVHLADVDALVSAGRKVFDPRMVPLIGVSQDTGRVRVVAREQTGPRWRTGRRRDVAVGERHTFIRQAINVRRIDIVVAMRGDGVEALLVGDDEDDVGAIVGHVVTLASCCGRFRRPRILTVCL